MRNLYPFALSIGPERTVSALCNAYNIVRNSSNRLNRKQWHRMRRYVWAIRKALDKVDQSRISFFENESGHLIPFHVRPLMRIMPHDAKLTGQLFRKVYPDEIEAPVKSEFVGKVLATVDEIINEIIEEEKANA